MSDTLNSYTVFNELGFKPYLEELHAEIQQLYLENDRPWVIGYSGGKDSTAVVQLIWQALAKLPEEQRRKEVHIITTDTLVENPVVADWVAGSLRLMATAAGLARIPFRTHSLKPNVQDSFWVNLIGRGYPKPGAKFRWCTERLKIRPSNNFILNVVSKYGEAILALGTRKAESQARARNMARHEKHRIRTHLSPNFHINNCLVYTPIEDWSNDDVWLFLTRTDNPWGLGNTDLLELYKDATEDRECPLVVNLEATTPSCGASRFGCWVCTLVVRDKSLEAMVANDLEKRWLQPLIDFRAQLCVKDDKKMREFRRMRGNVQLFNGDPIHGPYTQSQREVFLRELLRTENRIQTQAPARYRGVSLISMEELREIRRIWLTEKHEIEDRLPVIFKEAKGRVYPEEPGYYHCFGQEEMALLEDVCDGDRMSYEMLRELLDIEWAYRTKLRRAGLHERMEEAIRKAYYEDAEDAISFTKHISDMQSSTGTDV